MTNWTEREICIFARMAMRTDMAKKFPPNMINGLNDYLKKQFYPSLSKQEVDDIESDIDNYKKEFQKNMMSGMLKAFGGNRFGFESLKGMIGLKDKDIENLDKLKREVAMSNREVSDKDIKDLEESIKKNLDKD